MPTLMVSVSGIRGIVGDGLDPQTIVKYASAYANFCGKGKIVIGSDGRISGEMVSKLVIGTLLAKGNDVVDIGICPTPTVLFNVKNLKAVGGIQISASHNPNEWNALKLLNRNGEFMTPEENRQMLSNIDNANNNYTSWNRLGKLTSYSKGLDDHIEAVLKIPFINVPKIRKRKFKVLLDCVNGAGAYSMPKLLEKLGCQVIEMNCSKSGIFPRLPEPIPENLKATMLAVKKHKADIGIVVDPDVDRLVLITEKGEPFSEENTITQATRFWLSKKKGNVVVNLSTTRAVDDVANEFGCKVFRSPVGEANVVKKMKEVKAVIGGEGSGGVILPKAVFGRDSLTGTVIMLQHLLEFGGMMSEMKKALPQYFIAKKKIEIGNKNPDEVIARLIQKYGGAQINTEDGLRIDFPDHWAHFRKSNTEPIIRCIVEAKNKKDAKSLADKYFQEISN
ncbi:MAG: phosphoglucosamine mutase [Stygiobacter sp. RIFOXYA12_FULL_38_9]|nr:MAG: phosphoglucosamine mutase [Stygiobacter sp. GWC2_38_9]OGU81463.1 MAG: phosphoglucosamine mutase [Stygiobacter sp. RIFOXYA12_FULL_38_9]OGV06330.1 MAG: phosphoglucosamine mutase [Stygiobacter sp. RIFOXYB2_FULL_37_11]OGV11061.1 MAG: phosphoglucosamine mutase [Stygiobacter sp. RIFOXYA2_FULL_38_8]OGV15445.1 MAG: phosphoglucosamine mutase [Stygiobacter sp. RIFOXYC2_FULL_38_25]OGV80558.1 MAG: phosphoglucosamine mutase [Stygiobacter sp. GWF2_38_21]RJQ65119.1 MAG: phosphoglucosamine mutase [St